MTEQIPLILVTCDDGVHSAGLRASAEAVRSLGEVLIVAPRTQQTAMGRSFPRNQGQGVIETRRRRMGGSTTLYYGVDGSPAQTVAHAVLEIASRKPVLCISGINNGENLGGTNLVSGTVGAALEAASLGIPALAVSIGPEDSELFTSPYSESDWKVAANVIKTFAASVIRDGLPAKVGLLNINIPAAAKPTTEIRITTQSRQSHYVCTRPEPRDFSKPFRLPVTEEIDYDSLETDSDLFAFAVDSVVSVTPMGCDLTVRDVEIAVPEDL